MDYPTWDDDSMESDVQSYLKIGVELFSFQTGVMKDTNMAMQNTVNKNFHACHGDVINIHGCQSGTQRDTYLRLYWESGTGLVEIAKNDDWCHLGSAIEGHVIQEEGCNLYRIDMGCHGDSECSMKITTYCDGDCTQPDAPPAATTAGVELFPTYSTGQLSNTNDAMQNVESRNFFACGGDLIHISGCNAGSLGDTRIRMYYEGDTGIKEVMENDDYCELVSASHNILLQEPGCNLYRVDFGCYKDETCKLVVTATCEGQCTHSTPTLAPSGPSPAPTTLAPTTGISELPFHYVSGELTNTNSGYENVESIRFELCGGEFAYFEGCSGGHGDPLLRLYRELSYDNKVQVAYNDDNQWCDKYPVIEYTVPAEAPCHIYRLDIGCHDHDSCQVVINSGLDSAPTHTPTLMPIPGEVQIYFDDQYSCESYKYGRYGKHSKQLTAANYFCVPLDQCFPLGTELYMKVHLEYPPGVTDFNEFAASAFWVNQANTHLTYYPDKDCLYPIANIDSDCTNNYRDCCPVSGFNLMGKDQYAENGFPSGIPPSLYVWPAQGCYDPNFPFVNADSPEAYQSNTVPEQMTVYNKHVERIEEAQQRGHNNFGIRGNGHISAVPTAGVAR